MRNKIYPVIIGMLSAVGVAAQHQMDLKIYNKANTPIFVSNEFKAVGIGKYGQVWVGTWNEGVHQFNGNNWKKLLNLTNHDINDIKADKNGGIWIAQSGRNGGQTIGGGLYYFPDTTWHDEYYSGSEGLPNRNPRSLYIDNDAPDNVHYRRRVWTSHMADVTAAASSPGGIGRGYQVPHHTGRTFYKITDSIDINNYGNVQLIAGRGNERWIAVTENFGKSEVIVYNADTEEFIQRFNHTNSGLPAGFTGRAMTFDKQGRTWLGTQLNGVYVCQGGLWQKLNVTSILPANIIVNANAITADSDGNVFIGTNQGLIVYKGGPLQSETSYTKYTTVNGLPSNYVRMIAIDTITTRPHYRILATDNGMVFWNPDSVRVEAFHIFEDDKNNRLKVNYAPSEHIKVAADSSSASLFKFVLDDAKNCIIRIKEDQSSSNKKESGYFFNLERFDDSIVVRYHHPSYPNLAMNEYSRGITFQVYDTVDNKLMYERKVDVVRPPVLFVHGLFSNGNDAFGNFKKKLVSEGVYTDGQIKLVNYPADQYFRITMPKIIADKNEHMMNLWQNEKILASKLDVGGHSMGGVLLRRYLQSDQYAHDINKYVSFNTPHSGSPIPNFVLKHDWTKDIVRDHMGYDPNGGALGDLRLNSVEVDLYLNIVNLNREKVPSHLIVTTFNVQSITQVLGPNLTMVGAAMNLVPVMMLADAGLSFVNNDLYHGVLHDGAVSEVSQKAGLNPPYYTYVSNQHHSSTGEPHPSVYAKFVQLVSSDPDDNTIFTRNGFNPADIEPPVGYERRLKNTGSLDITSPATGTATATGTPITLNFNYTNVDTIIAVVSNGNNGFYASYIPAPASNYTFTVPNEHVGRTNIVLMGFNTNGFVAMDSVSLDVTPTAALVELSTDPKKISIPQNHYGLFDVVGMYNDGVSRKLTTITGATYTFKSNKAMLSEAGKVEGLQLGADTLVITYAGKSTMLPIQITDSTSWGKLEGPGSVLPVKMSELTGSLLDDEARLQWTVFNDKDVLTYEVQHSTNGTTFKTIDDIASVKTAVSHTYRFTHTTASSGKNFYRIKYNNVNGGEGYTNTVMLAGNRQTGMVIRPNPVAATMNLEISSAANESSTFRIVDASGKLLLTETKQLNQGRNQVSFNTTGLQAGMYLLEAHTSSGKQTTTFIKQ